MEITPGFIELQKAAEIIAERLGTSLVRTRISDTGALLESLDWGVIQNEIHIQYNLYGAFREMGVGKGVPFEKVPESKRKKKRWATKVLYREVARISEFAAKKAGVRGVDLTARITDNVVGPDNYITLNI
jgi:hypothetical protein